LAFSRENDDGKNNPNAIVRDFLYRSGGRDNVRMLKSAAGRSHPSFFTNNFHLLQFMILDHVKNIRLYEGFLKGIEYLRDQALLARPAGRHEIDGEKLFVIIQDYMTRPLEQCRWEAHRKYIDIQFLLSGAERMGHARVDALKVVDPYDAAKDVAFYDGEGDYCAVEAGMFAVFYPDDAHRPCVAIDAPTAARKAVFKVTVE
jgi:YhcH/YjgK/YiaL family protein